MRDGARNRSGLVLLALLIVLALSGCFQPSHTVIEVASTDQSGQDLVVGVFQEPHENYSPDDGAPITSSMSEHLYSGYECTYPGQSGAGEERQVMVRVVPSTEVLWQAPLDEFHLCDGDRLLWDGETLRRLGEDEPWPDGVTVPSEPEIFNPRCCGPTPVGAPVRGPRVF